MREKFWIKAIVFLSKLANFYSRYVLRTRRVIVNCIDKYLFLKAIDHFPDLSLGECLKYALAVRFVALNHGLEDGYVDGEKLKEFQDVVLDADYIKEAIFSYYLVTSYFFVAGNIYKNEELEGESLFYLNQAREIKPDVVGLDNNSFETLRVRYKKEHKEISSKLTQAQEEKVDQFEVEQFGGIKISPSFVMFFITFCTYLFFLSGFVYTYFILDAVNINSSYFFELSDYLSASVSVVAPTLLSAMFGLVWYTFGLRTGIRRYSRKAQFDVAEQIQSKYKYKGLIFIGGMYALGVYHANDYLNFFLYPLMLVILHDVFFEQKFWSLISNELMVKVFIFIAVSYGTLMSVKIGRSIEAINNGEYVFTQNPTFEDRYQELGGYKVLMVNSKYVFLWHNDKQAKILPLSAVKYFTPTKP